MCSASRSGVQITLNYKSPKPSLEYKLRDRRTLVDLPGLIHASNKSQSEDDVDLIKSLVDKYISEARTIILAVISAKNDYANQIILKNVVDSI